MTAPWMPPLPEPQPSMFCVACNRAYASLSARVSSLCVCGGNTFKGFVPLMSNREDELRAYGQACARAALERLTSMIADELDRRTSIDVVGLTDIYEGAIKALAKEITP